MQQQVILNLTTLKFSDLQKLDISGEFVIETATAGSYSNYLVRSVSGLAGLTVSTPCQIECFFASDCHFVLLVVNSLCLIGNFKMIPVSLSYTSPYEVSVPKGIQNYDLILYSRYKSFTIILGHILKFKPNQ